MPHARVHEISNLLLPHCVVELKCQLLNFSLPLRSSLFFSFQDDSRFLQLLFTELKDESVPEERYRELANLLQEICTYSLSLELEDRTTFYTKLCHYGFMAALEGMLTYEDGIVVETAVNVLHSVAEFNSSIVRDHIIQTAESVSEVSVCLLGIN